MIDLSKNTKIIISIVGAMGMVFMAAIFFEDRFENESDAEETKMEVADIKQVSQEQIDTLQHMQRSEQAKEQREDIQTLESYRNLKYLLKKQLEKELGNDLLEEKIERLQDIIEKLENKIYQ